MKTMQNPKPFFHNSQKKNSGCVLENTLNKGIIMLSFVMLLLSLAAAVMAQEGMNETTSDLTNSALIDMHNGRFEMAVKNLQTAYNKSPSSSLEHFIGVCYYNLGEYGKAEFYLIRASNDMVDEMKNWSFRSKKAPLNTLYFLGKLCIEKDQFDLAIDCFYHFLSGLDMNNDEQTWMIEQATQCIAICKDRSYSDAYLLAN